MIENGTSSLASAFVSLIPLALNDSLKAREIVLLPCPRVTHGRD